MANTASSIRRRRVQKVADETDTAPKVASRHRDNKPTSNIIRQNKKRRFCLHDQFMRTDVDIYFLLALFFGVNLWTLHQQLVEASSVPVAALIEGCDENETLGLPCGNISAVIDAASDTYRTEEQAQIQIYSIFYPVFCQLMAIFIYYLLSRKLQFLPYTAAVFLMGVGIGYQVSWTRSDNAILLSSQRWLTMNGQALLLLFLPGLIFLDAVTINVHLFFQAFWQLMIFAFPMVLAGAGLTGLVARYILPYGWGWNLSMTFGAILSATDPVAVAGLFSALGAPPRMQMHISGESLLNDGSSVLLYNIFSERYFHEMGVPDFGMNVGWAEGFKLFFYLTFVGALVGIGFGLGAVIMLRCLSRRLSPEENVVQVVLTVAIAYMAYFVAEILCGCSGIISTICCGLTVKVFGITFIHDVTLMLNFWGVLGELLNTLLFALGGSLWGNIISPNAGKYQEINVGQTRFSGASYGYLVALWLLLIVIRFILVFGFYPIISRIGIGSSWKEAVFMSFGGFRGTVGIALSLSLANTIFEKKISQECTLGKDECARFTDETNQLFALVGGVSMLTLLVNGLLSGPLLKLLKLAKSEKTRKKVVETYWKSMVEHVLVDYVRLLSQERFKDVDFSLIREHVPFLGGISLAELMSAVDVHKRNTPSHLYSQPHLQHVIPYIFQVQQQRRKRSVFIDGGYKLASFGKIRDIGEPFPTKTRTVEVHTNDVIYSAEQCIPQSPSTKDKSSKGTGQTTQQRRVSQTKNFEKCNKDIFDLEYIDDSVRNVEMDEERLSFIEILKKCYYDQVDNGELDISGDLQYSLFQGLEFSEDSAAKGQPLNDWNATKVASATGVVVCNRSFSLAMIQIKIFFKELFSCKKKSCCGVAGDKKTFKEQLSRNYDLFLLSKVSFSVRQGLAFLYAHRQARKVFVEEFASNPLSPADKKVLEESEAQVQLAIADLGEIDSFDVDLIKGHLVCRILINKAKEYIVTLSSQGLIPEKDANEMFELLKGYREQLLMCLRLNHEGILDLPQQSKHLRRLPPHIIEEFNLSSVIESMSKVGPFAAVDIQNGDDNNVDDTSDKEAGSDITTSLAEDFDKNSLFSSLRGSVRDI